MAAQRISFRNATIEDLALFKHWDKQPHVIACDPDEDWNWDMELRRDPSWRVQWIAQLNGKPIGFVQIIDPYREETHYWGTVDDNTRAIDIWIGEKDNLNKGFGTEMMQLAIRHCFDHPQVETIVIDPLKTNIAAQRFYKRLGFKYLEDRMFDDTICSVYTMSRADASAILTKNQ